MKNFKFGNALNWLTVVATIISGIGAVMSKIADEKELNRVVDEKINERLAEYKEESEES